jgi:hypothetical protein
LAIFKVLLDLSGGASDVCEALYEQLQEKRQKILFAAALPEGDVEIISPQRALRAAS